MPKYSPEVYRRRRIAVVIALLLVVGILWGLIAGIMALVKGTGSKDTGVQPAPTTSVSSSDVPSAVPKPTPTPTPTKSAAEYQLCSADTVQVAVKTDKTAYSPKEKPVFTLEITNTSPVECVANVGTEAMEYKVLSGNKPVFSTKDCQIQPAKLYKALKPGKPETARFTWDQASSVPGCATAGSASQPGMYQVVGTVGTSQSPPKVFELKAQ